MDKNWGFWMSSTNPNSHRLTDHDKCLVESFNHIIRHQNAAAALLEQLLEYHQANDADETTQAAMASVFTALQYIATANDSSKSALDDFGQKWKHNAVQFELNRRFAQSHNPDDESMQVPASTTTTSVRSTPTVKQASTSAIADSSFPSRRW
jgi:Tfp pilus assembly protein PilV